MESKKKKTVGYVLMVPALILILYIIFNLKFWVIGILGIVFGFMALVGYNMIRGKDPKEAIKDAVDDIKK